jgi:hypothetical protein
MTEPLRKPASPVGKAGRAFPLKKTALSPGEKGKKGIKTGLRRFYSA